VPGKADWIARALPTEGEQADQPRVGPLGRDDVVTCGLEDPVGPVGERVDASRYGFALVVTGDGTLLGRLRRSAIGDEADTPAEALMTPGPSTVRPDTAVDDLRKRLDDRDLKTAIVSDPEGRLIGVVKRRDLG
jgi:CBS domain-containing protein